MLLLLLELHLQRHLSGSVKSIKHWLLTFLSFNARVDLWFTTESFLIYIRLKFLHLILLFDLMSLLIFNELLGGATLALLVNLRLEVKVIFLFGCRVVVLDSHFL